MLRNILVKRMCQLREYKVKMNRVYQIVKKNYLALLMSLVNGFYRCHIRVGFSMNMNLVEGLFVGRWKV